MASKGHNAGGGGEEDGGHSVGLWYVSFSDMITLLLSFFVMLCTFSSYDDDARDKFAGAVRYIYQNSVFPGKAGFKDSYLPPADVQSERTEGGSDTPTSSDDLNSIRNPRALPWIAESDAYRDRKALYIPSGTLFFGKGSRLTDPGRRSLRTIANFLHRVPCQVVIAETCAGGQEDDPAASTLRVERAWVVVEFLAAQSKLPADRFNVSLTASPPAALAGRLAGQPALEIVMLSRSICQ